MNNFRNVFSRVAQNIPKGASAGAGGGAPLPSPKGLSTAFFVLAGLGLGGYGLYNSIVTIQPGHAGIIYNRFGGLDEKSQLNEGLNFVIPWFQRVIVYDVRTRPQPIDTQSGSKDFDARVLPSIVNEVTKAVVAQYNASELLTKRNAVSKQIRDMLIARSGEFGVLLDDVAITHLAFSKEYTAAVEAKQVAQQEAERAKYIVERALQEKKSIVIKAQGEAEAAQLIGSAIKKNPAFLELRKIDASRDIAGTLVQSGNKVYLNADNLMINVLGNANGDSSQPEAGATPFPANSAQKSYW